MRRMQCYEASVVPLAAFGAATMGQVRIFGTSGRELMLVAKWLARALQRERGKGCLCLSCDGEFNGADPASIEWSVAVTVPFSCEGNAIVSGICPRCAVRSDLQDIVIKGIRHVIPDARATDAGAA
jgi:hypothetical protein